MYVLSLFNDFILMLYLLSFHCNKKCVSSNNFIICPENKHLLSCFFPLVKFSIHVYIKVQCTDNEIQSVDITRRIKFRQTIQQQKKNVITETT